MAREIYVYWKVPVAQAPAAHAAAAALLQRLRTELPGLEMRLLRRAEEGGERVTFMETYRAPLPGVTPALQALIEAQATAAYAGIGAPARHVEAFVELEAPAA
jgi:hypothetical protein